MSPQTDSKRRLLSEHRAVVRDRTLSDFIAAHRKPEIEWYGIVPADVLDAIEEMQSENKRLRARWCGDSKMDKAGVQ